MAKKEIEKIIKNRIPGIRKIILDKKLDIGFDINILMYSTKTLKLKVILVDDLTKNLNLEIWNNKKNKLKGWTRNDQEQSLYVMWLSKEHFVLLPFEPLYKIFSKDFRKWMFEEDENKTKKFKTIESGSTEYLEVPIEFVVDQVEQSQSWAWNRIDNIKIYDA
jgi:hypothetical protein